VLRAVGITNLDPPIPPTFRPDRDVVTPKIDLTKINALQAQKGNMG
jgi:hypothetical protein